MPSWSRSRSSGNEWLNMCDFIDPLTKFQICLKFYKLILSVLVLVLAAITVVYYGYGCFCFCLFPPYWLLSPTQLTAVLIICVCICDVKNGKNGFWMAAYHVCHKWPLLPSAAVTPLSCIVNLRWGEGDLRWRHFMIIINDNMIIIIIIIYPA